MQREFLINDLADLEAVANALVEHLNKNPDVKIVLLEGNLGAGKTTLVQQIMKRLGGNNLVQSPTFSIINEYKTDSHQPVYHMDLYRLKTGDEMMEAGVIDAVDSGALCFIEWSNLVEPFLFGNFVRVNIVLGENGNRTVTLQEK